MTGRIPIMDSTCVYQFDDLVDCYLSAAGHSGFVEQVNISSTSAPAVQGNCFQKFESVLPKVYLLAGHHNNGRGV